MIGEQKTKDKGYVSVATKVPAHVAELLTILARMRGMEVYELLQLLIDGFITSAKANGPLSPELRTLMEVLQTDTSWKGAFSFTGISGTTDAEYVVLILRQRDQYGHPKHGFGLTMIDHPFCGGTTMTVCVDDIVEQVVKVGMPGLYKRLDNVGKRLGCTSLRETLILLSEYMGDSLDKEEDQQELPVYGEYHDHGRKVAYGNRTRQTKTRTPDSIDLQQKIVFDDYDREVADYEAQDWEGSQRNPDNDEPPEGIRPFGVEW